MKWLAAARNNLYQGANNKSNGRNVVVLALPPIRYTNVNTRWKR
ncbi:hypothetical protein O9992_28090 [Vibrio lentus]|nr:hypothetical protein [Vibrio lentus]